MTASIRSTLLALLWTATAVSTQTTPAAPAKTGGDQATYGFQPPAVERNYDRREVMVPMRDGIKLFTAIFVPKEHTARRSC